MEQDSLTHGSFPYHNCCTLRDLTQVLNKGIQELSLGLVVNVHIGLYALWGDLNNRSVHSMIFLSVHKYRMVLKSLLQICNLENQS